MVTRTTRRTKTGDGLVFSTDLLLAFLRSKGPGEDAAFNALLPVYEGVKLPNNSPPIGVQLRGIKSYVGVGKTLTECLNELRELHNTGVVVERI